MVIQLLGLDTLPLISKYFYSFRANESHYAVSTLRAQLREVADQQGEEILQYRQDGWCRLLVTFRALHVGIRHDLIDIPAYGGNLFDPERFPCLEGRKEGDPWQSTSADPIPVNNRTVLHLLEALQILQMRVSGGVTESRKLSFRALDIEQIGHVYEGLLDHTAVRALSPILGLKGSKDKDSEIPLEKLEALRAKGEADLMKFLKAETGRSNLALYKDLAVELSPQLEQRFRVACNNDAELFSRVRAFAGLVRLDTLEYPVVIPTGSIYVTKGSDRRTTGTHYTPRSLTEPIVQYTLEPLVYEGVAEGKPKAEWQLRSAQELLQLKICDMAMGSGAFLVQTCRYLTERLVEAWSAAERANPGKVVIAPEGTLSEASPDDCPIPKDADERLIVARRIIADRCLYGVDKNPMAVEMAKLSLWLITLQKNRPFTFLDHALRCGDSLLGVTDAKQIEYFNLNPKEGNQLPIVTAICGPLLQEAIAKRKELASFSVNDVQHLQRKEQLLQGAEEALDRVRFIGDLLVGEALVQSGKTEEMAAEDLAVLSQQVAGALVADAQERNLQIEVLRAKAQRMLDLGKPSQQAPRKTFHWTLEFPEVFLEEGISNGFAALTGNPPFQGGGKVSDTLGTDYREYLVEKIADGKRGTADLCAYFFLRAQQLLSNFGCFGLLATNTIAQGDTREVGLDQLVEAGCVIIRAVPSRKWPGTASLEVAHVWMRKGNWAGDFVLDETCVSSITSFLSMPSKTTGNPYQLATNKEKCFKGSDVYGMGFTLTPDEAETLILKNNSNKNVLFPFLNGEDLNSHFNQSSSRWIINFHDWPLDRECDNPPQPKVSPCAKDYPDCLKLVVKKVKSERDKLANGGPSARDRAKRWWQFSRPTMNLYAVMKRAMVVCSHTKYAAFTFVSNQQIFSHALVVVASDESQILGSLCSSLHELWAFEYGSSLGRTLRYTPSDCFETFPFPSSTANLKEIGERYYTHRQFIMQSRQEGLTKTYNRFHNPDETAADIQQLRELHVEMDYAVAAAYDWQDLDLGHNFYETKQGLRYTISEPARREVLDRLLQLNHQRYAEEVTAGLHDKGKKKGKTRTSKKVALKTSPGQTDLF